MKINIEDYLQNIDSAFKKKSQKDIYMTYVMIFAIIFAFSYLLFWDTSIAEFQNKQTQNKALSLKIDADNAYLTQNSESKIISLENDIKQASNEMILHKDNNEYIKNKIETISSLIYDERTWGEYLYSISTNAQKHKIKINNLTNHYAINNNSFGHVLDISIKLTGKYKNTVKFINSLERSDLVVDLHDFSIKAQDTLNSDLNISVWGITY
jgi:Tfp pilus assembly protein PilO